MLAFHVVGPSDCCIITGYDERGQVLMGWSTYQDIPDDHNIPHDSTGYFRKPDWHENLHGYILIEEKVNRPDPRDIFLDALEWAVYLMRMTGMKGFITGLEGLQAWAEAMAQPVRLFPEQEEAYYSQFYLSTTIQITMLRDHCLAEPFFLQALKAETDFEPELSQAMECYAEISSIRNSMDTLIPDDFSPQALRVITSLKIRADFADAILRIRDLEDAATSYIEELLERYQ